PEDLATFNSIWDAWVPAGHAPVRACIHAALAAPGYRVELVVTAARANPNVAAHGTESRSANTDLDAS
ncbi:MAG: Rid family hydrolase, partial [Pirellulaceae bacterium]